MLYADYGKTTKLNTYKHVSSYPRKLVPTKISESTVYCI